MRGDRRNADRLLGLAFNKIRATPARRRHRLLTRNDRDKTRKRGCVNCWIRQRTALINARRGLMAEFGIIAAARPRHVGELIALLSEANGKRIPAPLHSALVAMSEALASLERRITIVCPRAGRWPDPRAAAICEAMSRPGMRFVPVKSEDEQAALMLLKVRDLLIKQRTMLINAIRGHAAEFGVIGAKGPQKIAALLERVGEGTKVPAPRVRPVG